MCPHNSERQRSYKLALGFGVATALLGLAGWHFFRETSISGPMLDQRFHLALELGETEQVERMLKSGYRPVHVPFDDLPFLTRAVYSLHTKAIPLLAEGRLNERDRWGSTALYSAAAIGFTDGVEQLLKLGAETGHRDQEGLNALHRAAFQGHTRVVRLLLEAGMSADESTPSGHRAADFARLQGYCDLEQLLVAKETAAPPPVRNTPCVSKLPEIRPSICTGADPFGRIGGPTGTGFDRVDMCGPSAGIYAVDDPPKNLHLFTLGGNCCALPAADVIIPFPIASRYAKCPDNTVLVGSRRASIDPLSVTRVYCARINETRYQLGAPTPGVGWGMGGDWRSARYRNDELPAAIRWAVGRSSLTNWDVDGCIGDPIGSLLVEVPTSSCSSARFRQLQFAGLPGDPPKGTPVQMFPDCDALPDVWSLDATCDGPARYVRDLSD